MDTDPTSEDTDARLAELETELAAARGSLAEFFEILPMAMIDVELPSMRLIYVNRLARIVFGYDPEETPPALTLNDVVPPDELNRIISITSQIHSSGIQADGTYRRTGRQDIYETVGIRRDRTRIPIEFQSMFLLDEQQLPYATRVMFRDISARRAAEEERERLLSDLREALASVRTLEGLLPICAWCRKVRDDGGYWSELERYIHKHSDARFSHGICPSCAARFDPNEDRDAASNEQKR